MSPPLHMRLETFSGLARDFAWSCDTFSTRALVIGTTVAPWAQGEAREFSLRLNDTIVDSHSLMFTGCTCAPDGQSLSACWKRPSDGLVVAITYAVCPSTGVLRKHLVASGTGLLQGVTLEAGQAPGIHGAGEAGVHQQVGMGAINLGQPLFGHGLFMGIEHPAAENQVQGETFRCHLPTCWDLFRRGPYTSPPCVFDAAPPGDEWQTFMDYLDTRRPHPAPPFVALINNWYQFGHRYHHQPSSVSGGAELVAMHGLAEAAQQAGAPISTYCLDDPWAHPYGPDGLSPLPAPAQAASATPAGLWDGLSDRLFPGGLPALRAAAAPLEIGLWVGPFGGYLGRTSLVARGEALGFEAVTDHSDQSGFGQRKLCCHGTRYHAHLRESLEQAARQGVRYWKFDGVDFTCDAPDHGHPVGPGAATHQMDAWIDLMQAIRRIAPQSVIAFTTGSHPSPWWLPHVDFVWRGGYDDRTSGDEAPRRERFATYIDCCLQVLRPSAMPIASVVVFGLIQNAARSYASDGETLDDFARALWHMVGRGSLHHDLYLSPEALDADQWRVLATVLNWAKDQQHLLARSRMILGDPAAGEPYGFLAWRDHRGVLTLRNPRGVAQAYQFTMSEHAPVTAGARLSCRVVYGPAPTGCAGSTVQGTLPPYGVCVLELAHRDTGRP